MRFPTLIACAASALLLTSALPIGNDNELVVREDVVREVVDAVVELRGEPEWKRGNPTWKRGEPEWKRGNPTWKRGEPEWKRGGGAGGSPEWKRSKNDSPTWKRKQASGPPVW